MFVSAQEVEKYFDSACFTVEEGGEDSSHTTDKAHRHSTIPDDSGLYEKDLSRITGRRVKGVYMYLVDGHMYDPELPKTQLVLELDPSGLLVVQRIHERYCHDTKFFRRSSWEDARNGGLCGCCVECLPGPTTELIMPGRKIYSSPFRTDGTEKETFCVSFLFFQRVLRFCVRAAINHPGPFFVSSPRNPHQWSFMPRFPRMIAPGSFAIIQRAQR